MPFANAALLTEELQILIADNADVVLPVTADLAEPLHALYRRSTCLPAVTAALAGGQRRLVDFHPAVRVIKMRESNTLEPAAFARSFLNLNTPQELADAEQLAVSHPEW
jgi:molybdopterin-guanine dinucleotide biosynthesis protein A